LIARGVDVSEIFHYAGGPFNNAVKNPRVGGRDPQGRSYFSFASFEDPDGNGWLLQEIKSRLPGREWSRREQQPWTSRPLQSSSARRRNLSVFNGCGGTAGSEESTSQIHR
jgi:hypothetical protein